MKLLEILIMEGGNALKDVKPLTQAQALKLIPQLIERVSSALEIPLNFVEVIGSAGKKPEPDQLSNDIDLAVQASPDQVENALAQLSKNHRAMRGINVFSFAANLDDDHHVQVDLIPVENLDLARWTFQAHPDDLKAELKGAHRNELFFAVAKHLPVELSEEAPLTVKRYFYDLRKGLMVGNQTRQGKRGKPVKSYTTLDKRVVASTPEEISKRMLGCNARRASTFNGALAAIMAETFPIPEKRREVLEMAEKGIRGKHLKLPASLLKALDEL